MRNLIYILTVTVICFSSCAKSFLDKQPDDRITTGNFWQSESDALLALYGVYNVLHESGVYGYGGGFDACSPNAYQWAYWEGMEQQVGNGSISANDGGIVIDRWKQCYTGINRANTFLENIGNVPIDTALKAQMSGEVYFLRGVFYALLANSYGGVPVFTTTISTDDARQIKRNTEEETWAQVHHDYDQAIKLLARDAPIAGRATLGAAYAMKLRAYLYTANWDKVLEYAGLIEGLGKYSLFPSYKGLFQLANENNAEVIFDVQYMDGPFEQGSYFDRHWQPQNMKYGIDGSNSVAPVQNLVDAYETIDGSPVDKANPYANRDPRLDFTILRPGAYFQGQLYPVDIKNHTGQKVGFSIRKYTIETQQVVAGQEPLNYIVYRYADVLLSKAEALIQKGTDIPQAIQLINQIRTSRSDVKITALPPDLTQPAALQQLRHERRIEFALEGLYWDDVRRWGIGKDIYPIQVRGADGSLIETKFPNGYTDKSKYLPVNNNERSVNTNLEQNPGY
ncbi:RagB/SusD family nutrient uptake outer membrane protein [Chitinophaga sp. sic0106]|uniref:RagB/SusD family nutrient uptake outer membrane protein n=1 Tax=Chitinophaga sp. sic0106 TaxID=2854785 RepID=UPI001C4695D2|nr:RagB/SusD family nutrient uptake outer membrane protein [Chitinophaga sp. sic0106]MBV7532160.1 RagB/SusD family nutrient uptake outer membrane protein [Chitinophaga sp. sic0106]